MSGEIHPSGEREPLRQIRTPFTPEQVETLNQYQISGVFHPFTCGNESLHRDPARSEEWEDSILIATPEGWVCADEACDYTQSWAWEFMADPETVVQPEEHL